MSKIVLAAMAVLLFSGAAYAQNSATNSSQSNNQVSVGTSSGAQSSSVSNSNPKQSIAGTTIGNGASSSVSGSKSSSNTRSQSSSSPTLNAYTSVNIYQSSRGTRGGGSGSAGDPSSSSLIPGSGNIPGSSSGSPGTTGTSGNGDPTINYTGGYTVRNTPDIQAPSIVGGNPCSVGVSGGVSFPGVGIAGGATWADPGCERRQPAALLYNIGKQKAAVELMCQDSHVRVALRTAGEPCSEDQRVASAPVVAPTPVVARPAPPAPAPMVRAAKPDWCGTVSAGDLIARPSIRQQCAG